MAKKYNIKFNSNSVEMTKPNSTMLIYKIPYADIEKKKTGFIIPNPFIVYILFGKNAQGKDMIYVGKSKNGIEYRPTSHNDKYDSWTTCFILTQFTERTFFNDGTIQYLEDQLNQRVNEVGVYCNTTKNTNSGTANKDDEEDCDDYLSEAYIMLNILGLDLITHSEEAIAKEDIVNEKSTNEISNSFGKDDRRCVPNGIYYLSRKMKSLNDRILSGTMEVQDGKYILKEGSDISTETGPGLLASIDELRNKSKVVNGKLCEDIELNSPSACGEFVIGRACNGWAYWKTADGKLIDVFRKGK